MIKKVGIVSLSEGTIGEDFVAHEVKIGIQRLKDFGLEVVFLDNALKGKTYLRANPDKRAIDLINAFKDKSIDMILCAIGGDDTYRLLPYLFENDELKKVVNNKVFLGFSDSTINHLMLHKVGLNTFYGQSFLADICDIDTKMLDYSQKYLKELITTETIKEITPSEKWYEGRQDYSVEAIGTSCPCHSNDGFHLIQGKSIFEGKILGGCIETLYDIFDNTRYADSVDVCKKYDLFPSLDDWKGKIMLLETSEELNSIEHYKKMLETIKKTGVFDVVNGLLIGKPMDNLFAKEIEETLLDVIDNKDLPILTNVNIGHCTPRCIIPFGVEATVDYNKQCISFK